MTLRSKRSLTSCVHLLAGVILSRVLSSVASFGEFSLSERDRNTLREFTIRQSQQNHLSPFESAAVVTIDSYILWSEYTQCLYGRMSVHINCDPSV